MLGGLSFRLLTTESAFQRATLARSSNLTVVAATSGESEERGSDCRAQGELPNSTAGRLISRAAKAGAPQLRYGCHEGKRLVKRDPVVGQFLTVPDCDPGEPSSMIQQIPNDFQQLVEIKGLCDK